MLREEYDRYWSIINKVEVHIMQAQAQIDIIKELLGQQDVALFNKELKEVTK